MKYAALCTSIILICGFSSANFAATPNLTDANRLFDFAEAAEPALFFPPTDTQQVNAAGADWFFRYFSGSDSYAAISIDGTEQFIEGGVYVLGAQFGEEPVYVGTLEDLIATIDEIESMPDPGVDSITNQGNGNCVDRRFPLENDTARYRTTTFSDNTTIITERIELWDEVTDTRTVVVIENDPSVGNTQIQTSNRLTTYFESINGMFYTTESSGEIAISEGSSSPSNQIVDTTYEPALFIGPSELLCEGQEWFSAPVAQTIETTPDLSESGPVVSQTPATSVRVNAVGELVSVNSGTFNTIKMTFSYPDSQTIVWTDITTGFRVMSETYLDSSESPSSTEELLQLDLPF